MATQPVITSPQDWLLDMGGKSWAKYVSCLDHINLDETGGYSCTGPWLAFDRQAVLEPGDFMMVASQYPLRAGSRSFDWRYHYALVTNRDGQLSFVSETALHAAYQLAIKEDLIEYATSAQWLYRAAVYCAMSFDPDRQEFEQVQHEATLAAIDTLIERPRRRIDRPGDASIKPSAVMKVPAKKAKACLHPPVSAALWQVPKPTVTREHVQLQLALQEEEEAEVKAKISASLQKMFASMPPKGQAAERIEEFGPLNPRPRAAAEKPPVEIDRITEFDD